MLDLNQIRSTLAEYLADHATHRHSLDAAVMHVVEIAYQHGMRDAGSDGVMVDEACSATDGE